jgi:hypothetical protein
VLGGDADAEGLEAIRQRGIGLFDRVTAKAMAWFTQLSAVLTAEQRATLRGRARGPTCRVQSSPSRCSAREGPIHIAKRV